jgi:hypothetical protein
VGRRAEAVAPIEEAVGIDRRLAVAAPDAYLPDLARSLYTSHQFRRRPTRVMTSGFL